MKNYDIIKAFCRKIFIVGSGNFWYEGTAIGDDGNVYYKLFSHSLYSIYAMMTFLEILAAMFGDFPEQEKRESITFAVSHAIVVTKIFLVALNKDIIKSLNQNMVTTCETHEDSTLMAEKYKILKINLTAYCIFVYSAAWFFVFEGTRKYLAGSHFITVITYYPKYEDDSVVATSIRIFWTVILFCLLNNMILSVDGFTMIHLVMFKYKIITLRQYLEALKEDFLKLNLTDKKIAAERLSDGLVEGIRLHTELLRLARDIDNAFGTVIALQLLLSSGSAVTLLLQAALSDQIPFVNVMKILLFLCGLFMLLGMFLCNAGEITHEASLINESLFYCGWHECLNLPHRNVRKLVLMGCVQTQRPLVMKAFKMVELSYATFLKVVRVTYSVFALFYAQNK